MSSQSLDSLESCTHALQEVQGFPRRRKLPRDKGDKRCSHTGSPIAEHDNTYLFQTDSAASSAADQPVSGGTQLDPGSPTMPDSIPSTVRQRSVDLQDVQDSEYRVAYKVQPLYSGKQSARQLVSDTAQLAWGYFAHFWLTAWPYTCWIIVVGAFFSSICRAIAVIIVASVVLPRVPYNYKFLMYVDAGLYAAWRRIASFKVTYHQAIERGQQYIVAEFPHGVYPLGGQLHATSWVRCHDTQLSMLAADVLFWLPGWKHYMSCGGVVPATTRIAEAELQKGRSLGVHVGGIAEMFEAHPDREVIHLSRRRGFVRLALQYGVPVLPVYHFGNSQILEFWPRALQKASRKLRVSLGIFVGQFCLPVPHWRPLWTVAGAPLDMGPGMSPDAPEFEALVEQKHAEFTQALQELYETHKAQFFDGKRSWADRPLVIM